MGATLGIATLQTDVDQSGINKGLDKSEKSTKGKLKTIGSALTTGFGVAIAQGITSIVTRAIGGLFRGIQTTFKDLKRIQVISAQTAAVIESTGGAAGVTTKEIEDLSGAIEDLTAVEAESVQEGANMLLTFTNIGEDVFPQALAIVTDMNVALGQDLTQVAVQVGKALNDPVAGISALTRVGVTFTEEQKNVINSLVATGDIAGAQTIIIDELTKEFGGSAVAFGQTIEGVQILVGHQLGTIKETILGEFLPLIQDGFSGLNEFLRGEEMQGILQGAIDWIRNTAVPTIRSMFEVIRLLVTGDFRGGIFGLFEDDDVIGNLFSFRDAIIAIIDFVSDNWPAIQGALAGLALLFAGSKVITIITAIGTALATLSSPLLGAVIAAVALLGAAWATDFGGIKTTLTNWWNTTGKPIFDQLVLWLQVNIPAAIAAMSAWWETVAMPALQTFWGWVETNVLPIVQSLIAWLQVTIPAALSALAGWWLSVALPAMQTFWNWIKTNVLPIVNQLVTWLQTNIPVAVAAAAEFFENSFLPALQAVGDWIAATLFPLFQAFGDYISAVFSVVWQSLAIVFETVILPALEKLSEFFGNLIGQLADKLQPALEAVGDFLQNVLAAAFDGISQAIEFMTEKLKEAADWLSRLGDSLPDVLTPGSPTPFEIGLGGINSELENLGSRLSPISVGLGSMSGLQVPELSAAAPGAGGGEGEQIVIKVDTMIGTEQWIADLAKRLKPAIDRENIRTSAQGAGGLNQ